MADQAKSEGEDHSGATPKASGKSDNSSLSTRKKIDAGARATGKLRQKVHDRTEEYVYVTRDDLSEIRSMGTFHQILFGVGTFLASGAFWLAMTLLAEHAGHYAEFVYGFLFCGVCIIAGGALAFVGYRLFDMKQKRLDKYFPTDDH